MNEIWKTIKHCSDYKISDLGNVYSVKTDIQLKPRKGKNGYLSVMLYENKHPKTFNIHKLVATAFIENPKRLPVVNHKDGDKINNNKSNLEWATHSHNLKHAYDNGLHQPYWKNKLGSKHNKSIAVNQYDKTHKIIDSFGSLHEASRETNINVANIMSVCKGKRKYAGGYVWKYS